MRPSCPGMNSSAAKIRLLWLCVKSSRTVSDLRAKLVKDAGGFAQGDFIQTVRAHCGLRISLP